MKYLGQFQKFDSESFFKEKSLVANGSSQWIDADGKQVLGTKISTVIVKDDTEYKQKDGEVASNLFEKFNVKIPKTVSVPVGARIELVNPVGTIWGDFRNQLTVTADDIKILNASSKGNS